MEDGEARLVDDAARNQATVACDGWGMNQLRLGGANSPCIILITRQNSYLDELFILNLAVTEW